MSGFDTGRFTEKDFGSFENFCDEVVDAWGYDLTYLYDVPLEGITQAILPNQNVVGYWDHERNVGAVKEI